MPKSRGRRKSKQPKQTEKKALTKMKGGTKYLRMKDEHGRTVWRPLPKNDKET